MKIPKYKITFPRRKEGTVICEHCRCILKKDIAMLSPVGYVCDNCYWTKCVPQYLAVPYFNELIGHTQVVPNSYVVTAAKCECGAEKVHGFGCAHSDWCPKAEEEKKQANCSHSNYILKEDKKVNKFVKICTLCHKVLG